MKKVNEKLSLGSEINIWDLNGKSIDKFIDLLSNLKKESENFYSDIYMRFFYDKENDRGNISFIGERLKTRKEELKDEIRELKFCEKKKTEYQNWRNSRIKELERELKILTSNKRNPFTF